MHSALQLLKTHSSAWCSHTPRHLTRCRAERIRLSLRGMSIGATRSALQLLKVHNSA